MHLLVRRALLSAILTSGLAAVADAQGSATPLAASAPITGVGYRIAIDSADASERKIRVAMSFTVSSTDPVLLALPAWTPGSYELSYWAKYASAFAAASNGKPLAWDKVDYQTWRVRPARAGAVSVSFEYRNDSLDNSNSWSEPGFALLNGANLFPYPVGRPLDFASTLELSVPADWRVATGMTPSGRGTFSATNYHDLVDMPIVAGHFDFDSTRVGDGWLRFASYPAAIESAPRRAATLTDLAKIIGVESAVFGETPWKTYTVMQIADSAFGGITGLEHQNSHVDITNKLAIGSPILTSVYAHEIFHAWNVKRLRPSELWPYQYAHEQPTTWLWVSEGVTDYYADLAMVRSGVSDSSAFFATTAGKIGEIASLPSFGLDDASLSAWIGPKDGTAEAYYPKGSLAGLMLDIMIRDASDNHRSLDDVMRGLYRDAYKAGKGFTGEQWWKAIESAAGNGKSFGDFDARYVDGRDPYPWKSILPLAALQLLTDSTRVPVLGITTSNDEDGMRIMAVAPGSSAEQAGVQPGDTLLRVGDIPGDAPAFSQQLRARYGDAKSAMIPITVLRAGKQLSLVAPLQFTWRVQLRVAPLPGASAKAVRVRSGILHGTTG